MQDTVGSIREKSGGRKRIAAVSLLTLVLASCSAATQGGQTADGQLGPVSLANTSAVDPAHVAGYRGPVIYGQEFGLPVSTSDIEELNSTNTALQVLLSGEVNAITGSFLGFLQAREKQENLRAFCPLAASTTGVVTSTSDSVRSLADVAKPGTRVVLESPGGPNNFFMNLAFKANGLKVRTENLDDVLILDDGPQRFSALLNQQADVAVVEGYEVEQLRKQLGQENVHVLANLAELKGVYLAYFSTRQWLDQNLETATALCASVVKANRELSANYDTFVKYVEEYSDAQVPDRVLRGIWETVREHQLWPVDEGLTEESVSSVVDLALETGLLNKQLQYQEIVDRRPIERALEMVGGTASPQGTEE